MLRSIADHYLRSHFSVSRVTRRIADQLRGSPTLEQLIVDGLELGEGASVGPHAYLETGPPCLITIGDESIISDFAIIATKAPRSMPIVGAVQLAQVVIGCRVFVGPGAIILPGTRIGDDSIIDVRAVVSGEIPPGAFVSGNPGRIVGDVRAMAEQCRQAAADAPVWPFEGWSLDAGITPERMRTQLDAVAAASEGYVRASVART
jgi:acetyltransferase-like isoleucine patch superfamily enzyme